jgi:phosphoglycolate phosphatase
LLRQIKKYLTNFDLIYAENNNIDFGAMKQFRKLPKPIGFAQTTDIFPEKSRITVRTLEGDIDTIAGENVYLMIGIEGEVYPILREKFERSYFVLEDEYTAKTEYQPIVVDRVTGEKHSLLPYAKTCIPNGEKIIRAKVLAGDTKVFSYWDKEKYFFGKAGDILAANEGDFSDCYVIRGSIFENTYEAI